MLKPAWSIRAAWLLFLCLVLAPPAAAQTVILVRHAEKASVAGNDPPLSAAGTVRAAALQATLADAGVSHVIVTSRQRTSLTAADLTAARHLTPVVVPLGQGGAEHVQAVAAAVRQIPKGDVVLVVGHSNTIPEIIAALGGPVMPDICDGVYSSLFVLDLDSAPMRLIRASYGAPPAPGADQCDQTMGAR
jgi:broad specificity phosphatase PhoE